MDKVNFDEYADNYDELLDKNMAFFGEGNAYFAEYKVNLVHQFVHGRPKRILEYGCGTGRNLQFFRQLYPDAELLGCDVSAKSLTVAKQLNPSASFFLLGEDDTKQIQAFDLIFIAGVFHHVAPPLRPGSMAEVARLLVPAGQVFTFEHNPLNPVTRRLVKNCAFDADAILLPPQELVALTQAAGLAVRQRRYTLFFPAALKAIRGLENYLGWLPLGGQYFVEARKR